MNWLMFIFGVAFLAGGIVLQSTFLLSMADLNFAWNFGELMVEGGKR